MNKMPMLFTIDADIALAFRHQVQNRERSKIVGDFLRRFVNTDEPTQEKQKILDDLETIKQNRESLMGEEAELRAQLAKIERAEEVAEKELIEQATEYRDAEQQKVRDL